MRKRTRSPETAAEIEKLTAELGQVEAVTFRGETHTVDDILAAGLKAKFGTFASDGLLQSAKRIVAARFRNVFTVRLDSSKSEIAELRASNEGLNALVTRLRGEVSQARRFGALEAHEIEYIRTICKYGVTEPECAKMMGLSVEDVHRVTHEKPKTFSWKAWMGRRDKAKPARKGRALDL